MGDRTGIEWTDATWNPVTGCTKVSQGCKFCYAERDFHRPYPGRAFTDVQLHPDRLEIPLRWKRPRRIFVCSMSDLFQEAVDEKYIAKVLAICELAYWHTFQILTKRPQRMRSLLSDDGFQFHVSWFAFQAIRELGLEDRRQELEPYLKKDSSNIWLGVSCEDQRTADERIPCLLRTPSALRFVSYEPALEPVSLEKLTGEFEDGEDKRTFERWIDRLDWLIAGAESGPKARPSELAWFRSIRDQCRDAGVPFFLKQITERGRRVPFEQWPEDLKVREWPETMKGGIDE